VVGGEKMDVEANEKVFTYEQNFDSWFVLAMIARLASLSLIQLLWRFSAAGRIPLLRIHCWSIEPNSESVGKHRKSGLVQYFVYFCRN